MVSKNNRYLREVMHSHRVPHYGLRKLGIGVTSVLLGTTLYFGANAPVANADQVSANASANSDQTNQVTSANSTETGNTAALRTTATNSAAPQSAAANSAAQSNAVASSAANSATTNTFKPSVVATNMLNANQLGASLAQGSASASNSASASASNANSSSTPAVSDSGAAGQSSAPATSVNQNFTNGQTVMSNELHQALNIGEEPNGEINVSLNGKALANPAPANLTHFNIPYKYYVSTNVDKNSIVKVVYTGLKNTFYAGKPIKSAIYTFTDFEPYKDDNTPENFGVFNNIYGGFYYNFIHSLKVQLQYFYDDQQKEPVDFSALKGKNAFLTLGSLNKYDNHTECARIDNGISLNLAGSTITVHPDGWFYADENNDHNNMIWVNPDNGKKETSSWDTFGPAGNYVGAGIVEIAGKSPIVEYKLEPATPSVRDVWSSIRSDIPKSVVTNPKETRSVSEIVHYKYSNGTVAYHDVEKSKVIDREGYIDAKSGTTTWLDWSKIPVNFPDVITSPSIKGYTPDQVSIGPLNTTADKNIEETVIYTPDEQKAQLTIVDDTSNQQLAYYDQNGILATPINFNGATNQVAYYLKHGYKFENASQDGKQLKVNSFNDIKFGNFDSDDATTQSWVVRLIHATTPVTHNVTRTINYVDQNKKSLSKSVSETTTLNGTTDLVTETTTWSNGTAPLKAQPLPRIDGYHIVRVDRDSKDNQNVDPVTVNHDTNSYNVYVTYEPNGKIIPVDQNGTPIKGATQPQYPTDPKNPSGVTPNEKVPSVPGYTPTKPTVTPANPGKDTPVTYIQGQAAQVIYRDLDNKNTQLATSNLLKGNPGDVINYDPQAEIKTLTSKGYVLANNGFPTGSVYDNKPTTQYFYIDFHHGLVPVNSTHPNKNVDPSQYTKNVTETVHYVGAGNQTPKDNTQTATWTRTLTVDTVTDKIVPKGQYDTDWTPNKATYDEVKTPVVNGYHADQVSVPATPVTQSNITKTITYAPNGHIIPIDQSGNIIPRANHPQYPTTSNNPTTVPSNEKVPIVPGYTPLVPTVTPNDPGKDTQVVYTQEQVANVIYVDQDDNNAQLATSGNLTGTSGSVINYNQQNLAEITKLENEGYKLINNGFPAGAVYDNDSNKTQQFVVIMGHATTTVTPTKPGKPGTPINPNDPNGPKYPAGTTTNDLTAKSTQVVHYVGAGKQTPGDKTDTLTYTRTKTIDKVTGQVVDDTDWTPDTQNFPVIGTPQIKGYTPDYQYVGGDAVAPNTTRNYTVTYTKDTVPTVNDQHAQVRYLDQDDHNAEIANSGDLTGKPGTQIKYSTAKTIAALENQGYILVNNGFDYGGQIQYFDDNDNTDQVFIVTLQHGTQNITPNNPGKPGQPINPSDPNGPKYPTGTDTKSLLRQGTQTVHYIGAGSQTPKDNVTTVNFGHDLVLDKVTGQIVHDNGWVPLTQHYQVIDTPSISGYTPDHQYVGGDTVTVDNPNRVYTVTYTKNSQPTNASQPTNTSQPTNAS